MKRFTLPRVMLVLAGAVSTLQLHAAEIRWFELVSEDAAAANAFYSSLFGWQIRENATPDADETAGNWILGELWTTDQRAYARLLHALVDQPKRD